MHFLVFSMFFGPWQACGKLAENWDSDMLSPPYQPHDIGRLTDQSFSEGSTSNASSSGDSCSPAKRWLPRLSLGIHHMCMMGSNKMFL